MPKFPRYYKTDNNSTNLRNNSNKNKLPQNKQNLTSKNQKESSSDKTPNIETVNSPCSISNKTATKFDYNNEGHKVKMMKMTNQHQERNEMPPLIRRVDESSHHLTQTIETAIDAETLNSQNIAQGIKLPENTVSVTFIPDSESNIIEVPGCGEMLQVRHEGRLITVPVLIDNKLTGKEVIYPQELPVDYSPGGPRGDPLLGRGAAPPHVSNSHEDSIPPTETSSVSHVHLTNTPSNPASDISGDSGILDISSSSIDVPSDSLVLQSDLFREGITVDIRGNMSEDMSVINNSTKLPSIESAFSRVGSSFNESLTPITTDNQTSEIETSAPSPSPSYITLRYVL